MAAGVVAAVVDDGALDGEDADDIAGGGPENGADPETGVTKCYRGARFIVPRFWTSKIERIGGLNDKGGYWL